MTDDATTNAERPFASLGELLELVHGFETGDLPRPQWDHRAHLAVALWYLLRLPEHEASERMIQGIRRYNAANGISSTRTGGYHETITLFWLAVACAFPVASSATRLEQVNAFVRAYGGRKDLIFDYFSPRHLLSWRARLQWVDPDLRPLDRLAPTGTPDRSRRERWHDATRRARRERQQI